MNKCRFVKHIGQRILREKAGQGASGEVVGAAVVSSMLICKVVREIKAVAGAKAFPVLPAAAFHLAVVVGV